MRRPHELLDPLRCDSPRWGRFYGRLRRFYGRLRACDSGEIMKWSVASMAGSVTALVTLALVAEMVRLAVATLGTLLAWARWLVGAIMGIVG